MEIRLLRTFALFVTLLVTLVAGLGKKQLVGFEGGRGQLKLNGAKIQLSGNDWPGVIRAARDLGKDFERVTGSGLEVVTANSTAQWKRGTSIIVGTVGKSAVIDRLAKDRKIDVSKIKGKWEAYTTQIVKNPISGVSEALVIAGSDKRGSIFGIYEISEQIGVSPWYYWADTAIKKHKNIYALPVTNVQKSPSVKYRGIFLNDEQPALTSWVEKNFPDGKYGAGFHKEFYSLVFELLLRLKANFIWPTMWNSMFAVDDPENPANADYYGVVMSTSHTEPLQMSTEEWNKLGNGTWDYTTNEAAIKQYWRKGVERVKDYEGVWTIGMRGNGDRVLSEELVTELLEKIVDDQREIIEDILEVPAEKVPQAWCLYADIQAYYENGMRVPEDVTLLWTDDNWGNVRRLPTANETNAAGIYYHFDYVGVPRSYKWINTVSLQKTWDQLHLTYERNARDIWVVNVGDLKPLEIPIDYFLSLAYDYDQWGQENVVLDWEAAWATREFGADVGKEVAEIIDLYGFYAARRRFELVDQNTYSVVNYNEAEIVLNEWKNLTARAEAVYAKLDEAAKPSFFEMVLHPVKAGYVLHDIYISSAKNNLYGYQRRNSANDVADYVRKKFNQDHELTEEYHSLLDGKWDGMMTQTHLGSYYWQQPMRNALPPLVYTQTLETSLPGSMGVGVENSNGTVPGDDRWNSAEYNNFTLLLHLDPYAPVQQKYIDIFNRGLDTFTFEVSPHNDWVKVEPSSGKVTPESGDARVLVSVDWDAAPEGYNIGFINVTSTSGYGNFREPSVYLHINNTVVPEGFHGFVESQKTISIEAEHATRNTSNDDVSYHITNRLGRTLSGVSLHPVTAGSQTVESGPVLEYDLYTITEPANGVNVTVYLAGALNDTPGRPKRYAIAFGDDKPQDVQYVPDLPPRGIGMPRGWEKMAADGNTWASTTTHKNVPKGENTLKIWALEPNVVFEKIVVDFGGVKPSYLGPPESVRV